MTSLGVEPVPRSDHYRGVRSRRPVMVPVLMVSEGVAFAALVGLAGSPAGRVLRVVVVIAVTALAAWFARRAGRADRGAAARRGIDPRVGDRASRRAYPARVRSVAGRYPWSR